MVRVELPASELARALANALAFLPARSRIKYALIDLRENAVHTSGTDSYAAGTDYAKYSHDFPGLPFHVALLVDKAGLTELERAARMAKDAPATLTADGGKLTLDVGKRNDSGEPETTTVDLHDDEHTLSIHDAIEEMIDAADLREAIVYGTLCIDPALFSRFGKVKADQSERMADLLISEPNNKPILVKIGPTFKGLIMPIDRQVQANNFGSDGLW